MPFSSTGPKIVCASPNSLRQTKTYFNIVFFRRIKPLPEGKQTRKELEISQAKSAKNFNIKAVASMS